MNGSSSNAFTRGTAGGPARKGGTAGFINAIVTGKIAQVFFRQDHTAGGPDVKLIKPSPGDLANATATFTKPEFDNDTSKNDPVSYTMNTKITVDLVIDFSVTPASATVPLTGVTGTSAESCLNFSQTLTDTVTTGRKTISSVVATKPTPNSVQEVLDGVVWSVIVNGQQVNLGSTGLHVIYNTFGTPGGMMSNPFHPTQVGDVQDVTEERLKFAVHGADGATTEKACLDGIFNWLKNIHYTPGSTWATAGFTLPFQQYLWKCLDGSAKGECHMLASAFILACRIVGVTGSLDLGLMFPWGSRDGADPYNKRSDGLQGKLNTQDLRDHTVVHTLWTNTPHGSERLYFWDGNNIANNFEGVAVYNGVMLYPIGETLLDKLSTADQNASSWYQTCNFGLSFTRGKDGSDCDNPYPSAVTNSKFKYSD
jgi:hypothetical protein